MVLELEVGVIYDIHGWKTLSLLRLARSSAAASSSAVAITALYRATYCTYCTSNHDEILCRSWAVSEDFLHSQRKLYCVTVGIPLSLVGFDEVLEYSSLRGNSLIGCRCLSRRPLSLLLSTIPLPPTSISIAYMSSGGAITLVDDI